jgi:flagellar biosynthesis chaperone FliJ
MAEAYRLAALLKLRLQAREEAERTLALAQQEQTKARKAVEAAEGDRARVQGTIDEKKEGLYTGAGLTIAVIQGREAYIKRLFVYLEEADREVDRTKDVLSAAADAVAAAHEGLVNARQEEEALLKHKGKWELERKVVKQRREDDEADDLAQSMWLKK